MPRRFEKIPAPLTPLIDFLREVETSPTLRGHCAA